MRRTLNKEQKSGILLLLTSKTFERLAFYLVMTILVQFLMESLKLETSKAGIYYSVFYGVIGLTTLFSGLLGDIKDRVKIVKTGFIIMTIMYLTITFLPSISFVTVIALILLGLGIGLISPNISVFLGNIYNEKDLEIIGLSGFILLSITINIGALIAPPFSVFLKENYGSNSIFLVAFVFALISFFLFLKFKNQYNKLNIVADQKTNLENISTKKLNTLILISILSIALLIRFALNQKGLTFTMATKGYMENGFGLNQTLSNIEKYISIVLLLLFSVSMARMKKLNWDKVFNSILIGLIFSILAFTLIASFSYLSEIINGKSLIVQSYIFLIIAETLISPAIMYTVYRSSPMKYKGLLQGVSYVLLAVINSLLFLGVMLYEKNTSMIFLVCSIILFTGVVLIAILKRTVNKKITVIEKEMNRSH